MHSLMEETKQKQILQKFQNRNIQWTNELYVQINDRHVYFCDCYKNNNLINFTFNENTKWRVITCEWETNIEHFCSFKQLKKFMSGKKQHYKRQMWTKDGINHQLQQQHSLFSLRFYVCFYLNIVTPQRTDK